MKRKVLIVILTALVLPVNISAAENDGLLEETLTSETVGESKGKQVNDKEPIPQVDVEEEIELEELQEVDNQTVSEPIDQDNVDKDDFMEDLNFQDRNVNVVASGQNSGGMKWILYEDGLLELGGGKWALRNTNWDNYKSQVTSIKIIDTISPSDESDGGFYAMFSHLTNLENIEGLENLKTEDAVSFNSMFYGCSSLKMIDLSSFNTSKAKYMKLMFAGCRSLETLELSNFDTKNVENFDSMFS